MVVTGTISAGLELLVGGLVGGCKFLRSSHARVCHSVQVLVVALSFLT